MKRWLKKISVVFIAIMTLGLYIPPISIQTDADENKDTVSSKASVDEGTLDHITTFAEPDDQLSTSKRYEDHLSTHYLINDLTAKAKEQALTKLGPRIFKQVEDEFMEYILPGIEEVLQSVLSEAEDDDLQYYSITEVPTSGLGERIFHIYDNRTENDVIRFHVRRDNRPLEGYWFNFHYHVRNDDFEHHHEIGEIYWDKNIPPRWMS